MYKALYRKYRPMTFDDVVSQPHITTTLRNQLINNKTAHAYLFTGSRGTGKTTCARILAKALNCQHLVDGNPCLECEICHDADASALADIVEIDAASNNGVNDIRDLRDGAVYTAERCKYRVYIIDEVHMLTKEAFNALLKIMEEPPPHVKFILATTEVHKVLPTILSRCQRYDFRRILPADITERLMYVAEKEQINLDREAAELIAKTADGGMRDALSLLDQCVAFSDNITLNIVSSAAGIAGREPVFDIIEAISDNNAAKAIEVIDRLYNMSKDMQKLCEELIAQFRNVMLAKAVPENVDLLVCMPNELERIKSLADKLTLDEIMAKLDILQSCNERVARVSAKRVEMEMSLLKLCTVKPAQPTAAVSPELVAKIEQLEQRLANQPMQQTTQQPSRPQYVSQQNNEAADLSSVKSIEFTDETRWQDILEKFAEICPSVNGALTGSSAKKGGGYMLITTENAFFIQLLRNKENAAKLKEAIYLVTGENFAIRAKCTSDEKKTQNDKLMGVLSRAQENNIPVEHQ
ncbi:MAG: DNA polymerase III subunit gamma/tau [Oscillospiraceae bacterium]|nr:DNA polymerase III subunit gamma/tau [Oscillospiraceae bacterium]